MRILGRKIGLGALKRTWKRKGFRRSKRGATKETPLSKTGAEVSTVGGDLKYSAEVSSVGDERDAANTKISMGEERDAANTKTSTDSVSSHPDDEREGTQEKENQNNIFPHQSTRSTKSLASEISKSGLSSRKKEPSATKKRRFRITVVSSKKRREPERKQTLEEKIMSGQRLTEEDMEELLKQIREGGDIRHISKKQKNDSDALGMGVCVSNYFGENEEEKDRNNFGGCQPFDIQKTDFENYDWNAFLRGF